MYVCKWCYMVSLRAREMVLMQPSTHCLVNLTEWLEGILTITTTHSCMHSYVLTLLSRSGRPLCCHCKMSSTFTLKESPMPPRLEIMCLTYIHAYIHTYIHAYIVTYHSSYNHIHIHTYIHTWTYIHTYIHVTVCPFVVQESYLRNTYIHDWPHAYIHTYIHYFQAFDIIFLFKNWDIAPRGEHPDLPPLAFYDSLT